VATAFGKACAARGLTVVYGGGGVGLMGTVADAALAAGGRVIGVIPRAMIAEERAHDGLTQLIAVDTMHERKQRMAELADAFVALPGGVGTLEEVVEMFTWLQLGLHLKPVGLLNAAGFYDRLLDFFGHMQAEGFVNPAHLARLTVASEVEPLLEALFSTQHIHLPLPVERTNPLVP
jgi:uncharacterized protein (TIGR00730 family)